MFMNKEDEPKLNLLLYGSYTILIILLVTLLAISFFYTERETTNDDSIDTSQPEIIVSKEEREDLAKYNITDEDIYALVDSFIEQHLAEQTAYFSETNEELNEEVSIELFVNNYNLSTASIYNEKSDMLSLILTLDTRNKFGNYTIFVPSYTIVKLSVSKEDLSIKDKEIIYCQYCTNS